MLGSIRKLAALTIVLLGTSCKLFLPAAPANLCQPNDSFVDSLGAEDPQCWQIADKWANGPPNLTGWRKDHVIFRGSSMSIYLDEGGCNTDPDGCSGQTYAGGEYRTRNSFGYGTYTVRMRAATGCGLVSSFFVLHRTVEKGINPSTGQEEERLKEWDEIDIEILGKDTRKVQLNWIIDVPKTLPDGQTVKVVKYHEKVVNLPFDAAAGFHDYSFEWKPASITWFVEYVDSSGQTLKKQIHKVEQANEADPLPSLPGQIMMNLWAGCNSWAGCTQEDPENPRCWNEDRPATAHYDLVSYEPP